MKYLVDSDWVIDFLENRPNAIALLRSFYTDGFAIRIITFAEVYEGIYYGRDLVRSEAGFRRFLVGVRVLTITRTIARRSALVHGSLRAAGLGIPPSDILIAATAMHHNLTLVTRNVRHFQRIPGLAIHR